MKPANLTDQPPLTDQPKRRYKPRVHICKEDGEPCGGHCDMYKCKYYTFRPDERTGILMPEYYERK